MSYSKEYAAWRGMIQRCTNPSDRAYFNYGGRGISVTEEWIGRGGFERFYAHIGQRPEEPIYNPRKRSFWSLYRINNNLNYMPGNVRWATPTEQGRNKRNTVKVEIDGILINLVEWCEINKLDYSSVYERLRHGGLNPPSYYVKFCLKQSLKDK